MNRQRLCQGLQLAPSLYRQPGLLPGGPATDQRAGLGPARRSKLSRHTGACRFVLSSTVEHQRGVVVEPQLAGSSYRVIGREPDRARSLEVVGDETPVGP